METDEIGNGVEACREPSVLDATVVEAYEISRSQQVIFSGRFRADCVHEREKEREKEVRFGYREREIGRW